MAESSAITSRARKSLPEQVVDSAAKEIKKDVDPPFTKSDLLPTGSTMMNLACSGTVHGAFRKGKMVNIIGDSSSGKSLLCLHALIEAANSRFFKDFELYYDDVEGGCDFDVEGMLGKRAGEMFEDRINMVSSQSIEEWQDRMNDFQKREVPFIYILDSYDTLDSNQAKLQAEAEAKAREKGQEVSGSYGMDKVKRVRALFRPALASMKVTGGILIIISQTKAVIDPRSFKKKTRSAEDALEFHSYHCVWLAMAGSEKSKDYVIGTKTKIQVKKNRLTGKRRDAAFSIYNDYGIDDIGSIVDFLCECGHWPKVKLTIMANDLDIKGTRASIISQIEDNAMERQLRNIAGVVWNDIEESLKSGRKLRYE